MPPIEFFFFSKSLSFVTKRNQTGEGKYALVKIDKIDVTFVFLDNAKLM